MNLLLVHNYTREIAFQQELAAHWSIDGKLNRSKTPG
jgi:hypothetical protein